MHIKVSEQEQRFYLACEDSWESRVGHEIEVDDYRFCIIPFDDHINVSEVDSGFKVLDIAYPPGFNEKAPMLSLFGAISQSVQMIIKRTSDFNSVIASAKKDAINLLGEKPETENVNFETLMEE